MHPQAIQTNKQTNKTNKQTNKQTNSKHPRTRTTKGVDNPKQQKGSFKHFYRHMCSPFLTPSKTVVGRAGSYTKTANKPTVRQPATNLPLKRTFLPIIFPFLPLYFSRLFLALIMCSFSSPCIFRIRLWVTTQYPW